ncbi:MAG: hypothetical protein FWG64_10005 [Firmicutes bacterium]|nr:hypothetical protein [Bacillota bacterium]
MLIMKELIKILRIFIDAEFEKRKSIIKAFGLGEHTELETKLFIIDYPVSLIIKILGYVALWNLLTNSY